MPWELWEVWELRLSDFPNFPNSRGGAHDDIHGNELTELILRGPTERATELRRELLGGGQPERKLVIPRTKAER